MVIKELMKRDEAGITYFSDKNLMSIFEDSIEGTFENLSKTTYISLFYSIYKDCDIYDSEYNPAFIAYHENVGDDLYYLLYHERNLTAISESEIDDILEA